MGGAKAVFSDCSIKETHGIGVSVESGSHVKLLGCHVEGSRYLGVKSRNSDLKIEQCRIEQALQTGIEVSGGTFQISRSIISDNGGRGIWVRGGAVGIIEECDLTANVAGATRVTSDCHVTLHGNDDATPG